MKDFAKFLITVMLFWLASLPALAQTEADLKVLISACEFFAGGPLTPQERAIVVAEANRDFTNNPSQSRQEIEALKGLGSQLSQVTDPFALIEARQLALVELYKEYAAGQATQTTTLLLQKAQPLAFAPNPGLLLLQPDVVATVDYLDFVRQGQGHPALTAGQREQLAQQLVQNFPSLPDSSKAFVVTSQLMGRILAAQLQSMSQAQRVQAQQQIAQQQSPSMSAADYATLSALSRQQHLTTMNILENMGGSGDYWTTEVRPSW